MKWNTQEMECIDVNYIFKITQGQSEKAFSVCFNQLLEILELYRFT